MKRKITLLLVASVLFSGCSAKNGAIIGGTAGAMVGGLLGTGLSKQHVGNGKTTQTALQVGVVLGLVGALLGAGTGYVVEGIDSDDQVTQEIIQAQHIKEIQQ